MADKAITFGKIELIDTGSVFEIKYDGTLRMTIDQASGDFTIGSGSDGAVSSFGNVWINASTGVSEKLYVDGASRLKGYLIMSGGAGSYFIPPKLTSTERDALTPVAGMHIFNTTTSKPQSYSGLGWVDLV